MPNGYLIVGIKCLTGRIRGRCRGALVTGTSTVPIKQDLFRILINISVYTEYVVIIAPFYNILQYTKVQIVSL